LLGLPPPLFYAFAFAFGACIGSFLNVVIARLPAGESVVRPRSRCPKCGDAIPGWLNIPILSWVVLRGRCRACRAPISMRYPIVELLTGLLFVAVVLRYGFSLAALAGALLTAGLVAITYIDLDIWEIPDEISLPGIAIGALLRPFAFGVPWWDGIAGAAAGAAALWLVRWVFLVVRKMEGMGLGDVKLIAMIGAFLGPTALLPVILVASLTGSVAGIALLIFKPKAEPETTAESPPAPPPSDEQSAPATVDGDRETEQDDDDWVPPPNAVPFGPFLSLGALAELLIGPFLRAAFFALVR
jgi:leader peptidase (prepilin peptidase)/N-methyltransferase